MWKNNNNGKQYIGSAMNLYNRLLFYYSFKAMQNSVKNSQSSIYNAILKHGYSNFSLTILEYCEPEKCIEKEKYYIDFFGSEYNIFKDPTLPPMSGRTHSDATKIIMSDAKKGITGENNPMYGKNHTEESKTKISDAMIGNTNSQNHPNSQKNRNY